MSEERELDLAGRIIGLAMKVLVPAHEVQVVNYLTATGIDDGLVLNFGGPSLEFKRKFRTYQASKAKELVL